MWLKYRLNLFLSQFNAVKNAYYYACMYVFRITKYLLLALNLFVCTFFCAMYLANRCSLSVAYKVATVRRANFCSGTPSAFKSKVFFKHWELLLRFQFLF